mmetsp:Transcript_7980/g.11943  ORF Transcript_7980/g.11943 Transcript_7980/m.11943 type:complete len:565 (-) Transcript_7980:185-1879(-)
MLRGTRAKPTARAKNLSYSSTKNAPRRKVSWVWKVVVMILLAWMLCITYVLSTSSRQTDENGGKTPSAADEESFKDNHKADVSRVATSHQHLIEHIPYLPPHASVPNGAALAEATYSGKDPTIGGVHTILQRFLQDLHKSNRKVAAQKIQNRNELREVVFSEYMQYVKEHILPLDSAYRGRSIFPVREDNSIFMSLAAFRDHLLGETLKQAFRKAANPSKIFIGAIVQNCFGDEYTCQTGKQVIGKDEKGNPITKVSDAPPDANGIEQFCTDPLYKPYCEAGQIRVLYVNETESLGPAVARYYASKLWGGENFYFQSDAHLRFTKNWDEEYIKEIKSANSYPKAVLSAYPPGFSESDPIDFEGDDHGARLCTCTFSTSPVEQDIIRINSGSSCSNPKVDGPTQIAFIAAGFFFTHGTFLRDVPFDPLLPYCFMGEEIALSMRAWTAGYDIYAPRRNLIKHQYRPGRMGLPKFWGSVGRTYGRDGPGFNTHMQTVMLQRIKHMVGYPEVSRAKIIEGGHEEVLTDLEHYSMGSERTREAYLEFTNIDPATHQCKAMQWCNRCQLK